ncbi:MAG: ROK family protein [Bacilli bacterium]
MRVLAGVDIGGSKCAVSLAEFRESGVSPFMREVFPTPAGSEKTLDQLMEVLHRMLGQADAAELLAIGVSCGSPLDAKRGIILSPPNLPGWDHVDIATPFRRAFHVPVALQNDANACALAEWRFGAGRGANNMVFLTFGTGMGAGLILDGKLYGGASGMAGEIGHVRMADSGPIGYGKAGSFEGFCSGGGIARLARERAAVWLAEGRSTELAADAAEIPRVTARDVGAAAQRGDELARSVMATTATYLGRGLALLVDLFNPEIIVIGSIYVRQQPLLEPIVMSVVRAESLSLSRSVCRILPAALGEYVGDYAGLSVAHDAFLDRLP